VLGIRGLIEYASAFYTLYPGDCFYSGTTSGVGQVKPGDTITLESPGIGTMNVPVRAHVIGRSG
jgi:2-keto-4-pentenoate hydratase/2-oxohepta-3-ene-1,7-dioic acid hydratase in catechol pathway